MKKPDEKTILYVEDEPSLREVILELLRDEGFRCLEAANGEEAEAIIRTEPEIDVLITDFRMPKVNGAELLQWCRQEDYHFPVIFLSATDELHPEETSALGDCCADYLKKPVSFDELLKAIERAFQRQHAYMCNQQQFHSHENHGH